jgi:hypothetical protein
MNHPIDWTEHWRSGQRDHAAWETFASTGPTEIAKHLGDSGLLYLQKG